MPRQFAFVTVSNPTEPASSEYRRLTHSHAMRQVHAKKRRLRTQRYQGEMVDANTREGEKLGVLELQVSSPPELMPANSKDPFSSLARPLSSEEYFLLNHCRSIDSHACCYPGLTPQPREEYSPGAVHTLVLPAFRRLIRSQTFRSSSHTPSGTAACSTTRETTRRRCCENGSASPSLMTH